MISSPSSLHGLLRLALKAAILAIIFGTGYGMTQQSLRLSANDPQVQYAEEVREILKSGADAANLFPEGTPMVDITKSLAPFLVIYGDDGAPITGNASLNGALPAPPTGVFDETRTRGTHSVTWQPMPGTRLASVMTRVDGDHPGFVLSARSLREIEKRERWILYCALLGWLLSCVVMIAGAFGLWMLAKKRSHTPETPSKEMPSAPVATPPEQVT